jgi:hypothetical protein
MAVVGRRWWSWSVTPGCWWLRLYLRTRKII